jgi:23S rRNA pseudoU1915 N3-methylase RlmH
MNATIVCWKAEEDGRAGVPRIFEASDAIWHVEVVEAPDYGSGQARRALERQLLEREGKGVLAKIRPADRVVALCIDGKNPDSVIGAAVRLLDEVDADGVRDRRSLGFRRGDRRGDYKLSFSKMTFPHP